MDWETDEEKLFTWKLMNIVSIDPSAADFSCLVDFSL